MWERKFHNSPPCPTQLTAMGRPGHSGWLPRHLMGREELLGYDNNNLKWSSSLWRICSAQIYRYSRVLSPIGRNAHYCCSRYNVMVVTHSQETCARNLHKFFAQVSCIKFSCKFMQVFWILELLFIGCKFYTLEFLSHAEIDSLVTSMCT